MVDIKRLETLDPAELNRVMNGYTTDHVYAITRTDSAEETVISLKLTPRDQPYIQQYGKPDDDQLALYHAAVAHGTSFAAYDGETMIGIAISEPQMWNGTLWVWEIHVVDAAKGQGVGRALMTRLFDAAREKGMRVVTCETQNTNVPAIRFYRAMGFVLDGVDLSYYSNHDWPDGEVAVFMKRRL